jgi:hypothetical protein
VRAQTILGAWGWPFQRVQSAPKRVVYQRLERYFAFGQQALDACRNVIIEGERGPHAPKHKDRYVLVSTRAE